MAIERLFQDNFEFFTLKTNPVRTFSSSSSGLTGTVRLFPRASSIEKEVQPLSIFSASFYNDQNLDDIRKIVAGLTENDVTSGVLGYLNAVNQQGQSARKRQTLEIIRFKPGFRFSSNTLRKNVIKDVIMPFYRTIYPRAHFNFSNYHCLNFFTGSGMPEDSVLLYPNLTGSILSASYLTSSFPYPTPITGTIVYDTSYAISGAFTFDFWIKPTYTTDGPQFDYKPGTLMHLSGAYAISLHSGSAVDLQGRPNHFRLAVGFNSGANVLPSAISLPDTTAGVNLISDPSTALPGLSPGESFIYTKDNALPRDDWNHVTIRWGGPNYNFGSGSIIINGSRDTDFVFTEQLVLGVEDAGVTNPTVLCVGNHYEGVNFGLEAMSRFFAINPALREGLHQLDSAIDTEQPDNVNASSFAHPLNAEVHELKLYDRYLTVTEIERLNSAGPVDSGLNGLRFYLPPFFTEVSPYRQFVAGRGGVLVTPFFERDGATNDPFAARMAFGAGGHYVNLENYVRDFATGNYPRLWNLSGSSFEPGSAIEKSANDFLYNTGSIRRRLYTILPCDNGDFLPNFDLLGEFTGSTKFVSDLGNQELGVVSLNNIVDINDFPSKAVQTSGSILNDILGARPEAIDALPGDSLAILHRTRDPSSNQIVFFDVSNIFYGNRIKPGTLIIQDVGVSGSSDKIKITIKDDGNGNLYRADANGSHPTWASIGNIFYDEGIALIKHPNLFFFGENQFEISFEGEQNVHVLTINSFARAMTQTSSSNPSYLPIKATDIEDLANDTDNQIVFITGINIHDDNLNVIARTNLAQPIIKRSGDKFLFKVKLDW